MADTTIVVAGQPVITTIVATAQSEPIVIEAIKQGPPGDNNLRFIRYIFNHPLSEWIIPHNQNTSYLSINIVDDNNITHYAKNITMQDNNTCIINFTSPIAGYADILFIVAGAIEVSVV